MFEKCINHQLLQYFESHSFLRHDQSAFRRGHSTGTALHQLVDDLLEYNNEGMMNAICVFFYFKKYFYTINHDLLLLKFQMYGVENNELLWSTNYNLIDHKLLLLMVVYFLLQISILEFLKDQS